jgi:hypothetical protein
MLGERLEKLEKDLHLLSAMQELFLTSCSNSSGVNLNTANIPAREQENNNQNQKGKPVKKQCNQLQIKNTNVILQKDKGAQASNQVQDGDGEYDLEKELAEKVTDLEEQLNLERGKRDEVEENGRRVALELQKVNKPNQILMSRFITKVFKFNISYSDPRLKMNWDEQ